MMIQAKAYKPEIGTETILLAEDNELVRNMTVSVLEHSGYEVILAVDGKDAVNKYHEHKERIKLLLFDLIMPKKSGKEAYDEIRKITPDIKLIVTSGFIPRMVREKLPVNRNMTLIYKPILPSYLLKIVRSVLDRAKAAEPVISC